MRVAIHTLGTRGDVQPYVALALGLKAAGHEVLIAAPSLQAAAPSKPSVPVTSMSSRAHHMRSCSPSWLRASIMVGPVPRAPRYGLASRTSYVPSLATSPSGLNELKTWASGQDR
jgi:hypothetical protein